MTDTDIQSPLIYPISRVAEQAHLRVPFLAVVTRPHAWPHKAKTTSIHGDYNFSTLKQDLIPSSLQCTCQEPR